MNCINSSSITSLLLSFVSSHYFLALARDKNYLTLLNNKTVLSKQRNLSDGGRGINPPELGQNNDCTGCEI
jgi:hypothetical protein